MQLTPGELFALAEVHGDAFFVLDLDRFRANYREFEAAFRAHYGNVRLGYSYKTNYAPAIVRAVSELGGYAEVVSLMEYELARRVGVEPADIIVNGPYKTRAQLEGCLAAGALVNLDADYEVELLEELGQRLPPGSLRVGLRCNFDVGERSRFGFAAGQLGEVVARLQRCASVRLAALHCHFNTRHRSVDSFRHRAKTMIRLARQLGIADALEIIDLGSGFFSKMPESLRASFPMHVPSYQEYGAAVGEVFASEFANGGPQLVLEPGKPIVADAMLFATRVVEIKHIESRTYIQVAGSVYDIRPTKAERNLPLTRYARDSLTQCATDVHADIVGYTCMEDDVLHRDYRGQVARGDWFVFENCGAYTNVLKPPFIGGAAPIVVLDQGTARLARRRETLDDLLRAYLLNGS